MQVKENGKQEIEEKFLEMSEYLRMNYLENCLKSGLDFETRKFVLVKLCGLYESKKMFVDAGKMMLSATEINTTYQGKINDFMKANELFIKGADYKTAENTSARVLALGNNEQKKEIKKIVKEQYKTQARYYLSCDKRKKAMEIYEILLTLGLDESEKKEVKDRLGELYRSLGMGREFDRLKNK